MLLDHTLILSRFGTKVMTVRVGQAPNHTDFTVHENLLSRTPFLAEAINSKKDSTTYIEIGDHSKSAFGLYLQWLYTGRLHTKPSKVPLLIYTSPSQEEWHNLTDAYLLGERLGDIKFKDTVIDAMLEWFFETLPKDRRVVYETAPKVYLRVQAGGPLRRLISDMAAYHFDDQTIQEMATRQSSLGLPYDFLSDTLVKFSSRMQGSGASTMSKIVQPPVFAGRGTCNYHCHGDNECYKKD